MQYTPYLWPMAIGAGICALIAVYVRRFPDVPAVRPFSALMWCASAWAVIYALNILTVYLPLKIFFSLIMYVPTRCIPPLSLLLVLEYGGKERWITRRNLVLLFAIPVAAMAASLTSPWHTLFRFDFRMEFVGSLSVLRYKGGIVYWISTVYGNALMVVALALMLPLFRSPGLHKRNTGLLFFGLFAPTLLNVLFSAGLSPIKGYSFAPTMLVITGGSYLLALLRYRLFGVALIARSTVVDSIVDPVAVLDTSGHLIDFNRAAEELFGLSRFRSIGEKTEALPPVPAEFFRKYGDGEPRSGEVSLDGKDAARSWDLSVTRIEDSRGRARGRIFLLHDVSRRKEAEATVQRLLAEKELLLHEVHHRIKNNMSTMASILTLQEDAVAEPAAKAALRDARSRMQSMMVLYGKLYVNAEVETLDAEAYLSPLIDEIVSTFPNAGLVRVDKRFQETELDARTLFSLGIVVNELLTNAMKHAFVGRERGVVSFSLERDDRQVRIEVADDGVGLPEGAEPFPATAFGLNLARILLAQLHGTVEVRSGGGTRFAMSFVRPACRSEK